MCEPSLLTKFNYFIAQVVMFGPMASTSNTFDESQLKYTWWHGLGLRFTGVSPQGHDKVILRSHEGQISLK